MTPTNPTQAALDALNKGCADVAEVSDHGGCVLDKHRTETIRQALTAQLSRGDVDLRKLEQEALTFLEEDVSWFYASDEDGLTNDGKIVGYVFQFLNTHGYLTPRQEDYDPDARYTDCHRWLFQEPLQPPRPPAAWLCQHDTALDPPPDDLEAMLAALRDVARQKTSDEMETDADGEISGCFQEGYDAIIGIARAALEKAGA